MSVTEEFAKRDLHQLTDTIGSLNENGPAIIAELVKDDPDDAGWNQITEWATLLSLLHQAKHLSVQLSLWLLHVGDDFEQEDA